MFRRDQLTTIKMQIHDPLVDSRIFNPSVLDDYLSFNVNGWRLNPGIAANWSRFLQQSRVAVFHRENLTLHDLLHGAEDMRLFRVGGQVYGLFTRYLRRRQKRVWLYDLRRKTARPIRYEHTAYSEGNWLPFVHRNRTFVSYSMCPHVVLALHLRNATAIRKFVTRAPNCDPRAHGGASGVSLDRHTHIGMAHVKRRHLYTHVFFKRETTPPFSLRFSTPTTTDEDFILSLQRNRTHLYLYSGRADQSAHMTTFSIDVLRRISFA